MPPETKLMPMKSTCCNADIIQAPDGDGWMCKQCFMPTDAPELAPTNKEQALMPCPFCGGEASQPANQGFHPNYTGRFIACIKCGANMYRSFSTDGTNPDINLVQRWNTRATPPTPPTMKQCSICGEMNGHADGCSTVRLNDNYLRDTTRRKSQVVTIPTSPDWIKEASEEIEHEIPIAFSTEDLEQIKQILTKHAAGLVEDKERLDYMDKHRTVHIYEHFKFNPSTAASQKTWRTAITAAMKGSKD